MPIATRGEAERALQEILALPSRPQQLMKLTIAIAQCTTDEARAVLQKAADGLQTAKRPNAEEDPVAARQREEQEREMARRAARAAEAKRREEAILDHVRAAVDALRETAALYRDYPALGRRFEPWEVARLAVKDEAVARQFLDRAEGATEARLVETLQKMRPWFVTHLQRIRTSCGAVAAESPGRCTAEILFNVIAATDMKALYAAEARIEDPETELACVRAVRACVERLLAG
jgi:hypothetical protein